MPLEFYNCRTSGGKSFQEKERAFFLIINLSVNVLCEMRTYSPTSTSYRKFASYPNIIIVIFKNTTLLDFYLGTDLQTLYDIDVQNC